MKYKNQSKFSAKDRLSQVTIPERVTPDLAEFIGIMVGDGHVCHNLRKGNQVYEFQIAGNIADEEYYDIHVLPLFRKLFNTDFIKIRRPKSNSLILVKNSKGIHSFLKEEFKIPPRKDSIGIPEQIIKSDKSCKARFLRGLFDADFCFVVKHKPNAYPVVQGSAKSKSLIIEVKQMLSEFGIESFAMKDDYFDHRTSKVYKKHSIFINGRKRVGRYFKEIGFANRNKKEKYLRFLKEDAVNGK